MVLAVRRASVASRKKPSYLFLLLLLFSHAALVEPCAALGSFEGQQGVAEPQQPVRRDPVLKQRPPVQDKEQPEKGRLSLDVAVINASGDPVPNLKLEDFTLLDNNHPQKIAAFRALEDQVKRPETLVSIILVIDQVNAGPEELPSVRSGVEKFLKQDGGHLAQPVTIVLLTDAGFQIEGKTTEDGKALAQVVHNVGPPVHTFHSMGPDGTVERFQLSVRSLATMINNEIPEPGRKIVVWIGPGWPTLRGNETTYNARGHQLNFNVIASMTNGLREARMTVCSAGGGSPFFFHDYLGGIKTPVQANSGDLALQVFAIHSGGLTLEAVNRSRSEELINRCLQQIGPFYELWFDPPHASHSDEYHDLKIKVARPGLKADAISGYYSQP